LLTGAAETKAAKEAMTTAAEKRIAVKTGWVGLGS